MLIRPFNIDSSNEPTKEPKSSLVVPTEDILRERVRECGVSCGKCWSAP